ncbi:dihydroneopterin aldolase [Helicobacter sp. 11S03491-1]|uniref:dihydroneopterin aldolase n=1 Tax=Helicobacter sp. 11S03491-1 TaxID=1476196 RepID=UPI000BA663A0|nr:dihydroneopterin aldolase [Helicobacter sp. 11S03491-1]PAF43020.1 hypothetical protein BKH45_02825 [Helicobacter sp. 11S03491-1]
MQFTLIIQDLKLKIIIGILESERLIPQEILLEGKITYEYTHSNFVDYIKIKDCIKKLLENNQYQLLEEALLDIIEKLKDHFQSIQSIKLSLKKLKITPDCTVGVEINHSF